MKSCIRDTCLICLLIRWCRKLLSLLEWNVFVHSLKLHFPFVYNGTQLLFILLRCSYQVSFVIIVFKCSWQYPKCEFTPFQMIWVQLILSPCKVYSGQDIKSTFKHDFDSYYCDQKIFCAVCTYYWSNFWIWMKKMGF